MTSESEIKMLCAGRHLSLVARGNWEYATRATKQPAVGIVAITDDNRVVLVEQYRPPVGEHVIELPAGLSGDVAGSENESLLEAAKRELFEETGYTATRWAKLVPGYSSPGLTDEMIVLFLAEGLSKTGRGGGDSSEAITVHEIAIDEVAEWVAAKGAKADLKLYAGLFTAEHHRRSGK